MISHVIYHIPGRKVGCAKDLEFRKLLYLKVEGAIPDIEVLQELHDKTDKEAGDIEWEWADSFGYKRGVHYTVTINAIKVGSRRAVDLGVTGFQTMTQEDRVKYAKKGGRRSAELGLTGFQRQREFTTPEQRQNQAKIASAIGRRRLMETSTSEQRSEWVRAGGRATGRRLADSNSTGYQLTSECPHCGIVTNLANLKRWHLDNCPKKKRITRRAPLPC